MQQRRRWLQPSRRPLPSGIVVCFSASNGGWGFPSQHPDVLAVGGVFMNPDGTMRASDYSSGFMSNVYPGRRVPDVSGLVGMQPRAAYIMLPLAEGSAIDASSAGGTHPVGDETANNDGWAAFSGTSASCPQVAGVCALIRQACPRLTPAQVRDILMATARDVTTGTSSPLRPPMPPAAPAPGNPATVGPDAATGNGLVDAYRAVLFAKLRCIAVVPFTRPVLVPPVFFPAPPVVPIVSPRPPIVPIIRPRPPIVPIITPNLPPVIAPLRPLRPLLPFGPGPGPDPGPLAEAPGAGLTSEDVAALEQMIIESGEWPLA